MTSKGGTIMKQREIFLTAEMLQKASEHQQTTNNGKLFEYIISRQYRAKLQGQPNNSVDVSKGDKRYECKFFTNKYVECLGSSWNKKAPKSVVNPANGFKVNTDSTLTSQIIEYLKGFDSLIVAEGEMVADTTIAYYQIDNKQEQLKWFLNRIQKKTNDTVRIAYAEYENENEKKIINRHKALTEMGFTI